MRPQTASPPSQTLFVFGSTHHTAPLQIREKIALDSEKVDALYRKLRSQGGIQECLILNTCNRVEVYGVTRDPDYKDELAHIITEIHHLQESELEPFLFCKTHHEVAEHLFQVSAGVDSQLIGETEIFGQVKQSYADALERQTLGPILNRLFQRSFKEAKWARTHTGISKGQTSIGSVTVDLANRIFGNLNHCSILILGSGEVAEKTTQSFQSRGAQKVTVSSRNYENAHLLANRFGGNALDFEHFRQHLSEFDIVVSSTRAPGTILEYAFVKGTMAQRPARPLFIIDLAMPRDVDPKVASLDNVFLYNLDDLAEIANENLQARMEEVDAVKNTFARKAWQVWLNIMRRSTVDPTPKSKDG